MAAETILLVEDLDDEALGSKFALSQEGFKVIREATAVQARKSVSDFVPDIIIPDRSGYDLCRDYSPAGLRHQFYCLQLAMR